jgi:hypothetical protein
MERRSDHPVPPLRGQDINAQKVMASIPFLSILPTRNCRSEKICRSDRFCEVELGSTSMDVWKDLREFERDLSKVENTAEGGTPS